MNHFTANDMEKLFAALANELEIASNNTTQFDLYLTGGGAMMLSIGVRRTTTDVDVVFQKNADIIHECALRVSDRLGVDRKWCNDLVRLSSSYTPAVITNSTLYRTYGCLNVYTVNAELLSCMKLISFREKGLTDIYFLVNYFESNNLHITTDILNQWYEKYFLNYGKSPKIKKAAI